MSEASMSKEVADYIFKEDMVDRLRNYKSSDQSSLHMLLRDAADELEHRHKLVNDFAEASDETAEVMQKMLEKIRSQAVMQERINRLCKALIEAANELAEEGLEDSANAAWNVVKEETK